MLNQLLRPVLWRIRGLLGTPPRSLAEEVWRLRGLRHRAPGVHGTLTWQGKQLHFADGYAAFQQFNEIFAHGVYDFQASTSSPRIIDGGAHTGCAVLRWRKLFPLARITAIEADAEIAGLLRQNLANWGDRDTEVINAAAWINDGEIRFAPTGRDNGVVTEDGSRVVPALDLARLCREPVDLLKLDVEGAESPILTHLAETNALRQVKALVCEWHEWESRPPQLHAALARLVEAGFIYRIVHADTLGDAVNPVFPRLKQPGNQLMIYAWQP